MLQILFFSAILGTEVAIKILKFRSWGYASNKPKVLKNVSLHVLICQKMMYDIIISEGTTRETSRVVLHSSDLWPNARTYIKFLKILE